MLVFGSSPETLPVTIRQDATTGLPLLREQHSIIQIVLAYLALPYSVTEYGCGKKASLIIEKLLELQIPPYAVARGMILERDMSPAAMAQENYEKREHALIADNPLYELGNTSDPKLRDMLEKTCPEAKLIDEHCVQAGHFLLRHAPQVQFVTARSHIYTIVTFWDDKNGCAEDRVIDPSLHRTEFFDVAHIRELLHSPQALLFQAPLLARFRLHETFLTAEQRQELQKHISGDRSLTSLSVSEHAELVRNLTGAEPGTLGDPETWTYANNIKVSEDGTQEDKEHFLIQERDTGRGDGVLEAKQRLIHARESRSGDASAILAELRQITEESDVWRIVKKDAQWSAIQLEPLADAATIFVYYKSLSALAETIQSGKNILGHLQSYQDLQPMRGIGVRLRRRIDWVGRASLADDGRIDARALNHGFTAATLETIRQMNLAGLTVFIDRVGNLHGLLLDDDAVAAIRRGERSPRDYTNSSIGHGSHIDTVNDAGKFDGRLGVLAGVETAHVLSDLARYFDIQSSAPGAKVHTHVSAFIGEEMTFTGQGVSMPGSAAVAGRATPQAIHNMRNGDSERFGDCLNEMLKQIKKHQIAGEIALMNDLTGTADDELLEVCSDPREFFTAHTYERHIEQGPFLDRADVPMAMVGTIMGIYQEDFFFKGGWAEAAALEMNRRMRDLTNEQQFADVRITVGIMEGCGNSEIIENVYPALRWTLEGELNHAGATPTRDRRDPGVAAARLARQFLNWFYKQNDLVNQSDPLVLRPVISNLRVCPGTNRNVIPGSVSMTIGLSSDNHDLLDLIDDLTYEDLTQTLEGYAVATLARQVAGGGEGVRLCRVEPVSYTNVFNEARLSIDLRSDQQATSNAFRERIDEIIEDIIKEYSVEIRGELQQKLQPFYLEDSGQALLMERSYGGSHNPHETELLSDILRGCILQIAVTRKVLARENLEDFNLFKFVESHVPEAWRKKLPRFTSGALHDTSNIAASVLNVD